MSKETDMPTGITRGYSNSWLDSLKQATLPVVLSIKDLERMDQQV